MSEAVVTTNDEKVIKIEFPNELNLNIQQGLTGPAGERGPKGDQGDVGPIGPRGEQGPQGLQGPKGERGEKGDKGDKGERGPKGEQGLQGIPGVAGPMGPMGLQGIQGPRGDKGPKGETGDKGPKGDRGPQGEQGPAGEPGKDANTNLPTVKTAINAKGYPLISDNIADILDFLVGQMPEKKLAEFTYDEDNSPAGYFLFKGEPGTKFTVDDTVYTVGNDGSATVAKPESTYATVKYYAFMDEPVKDMQILAHRAGNGIYWQDLVKGKKLYNADELNNVMTQTGYTDDVLYTNAPTNDVYSAFVMSPNIKTYVMVHDSETDFNLKSFYGRYPAVGDTGYHSDMRFFFPNYTTTITKANQLVDLLALAEFVNVYVPEFTITEPWESFSQAVDAWSQGIVNSRTAPKHLYNIDGTKIFDMQTGTWKAV